VTSKRRYYVDFEHGSLPMILPVEPGDEDYEYAETTLAAAKKKAIKSMRDKIGSLREAIKDVRQSRAADFN
jgi:hypothetical protein